MIELRTNEVVGGISGSAPLTAAAMWAARRPTAATRN